MISPCSTWVRGEYISSKVEVPTLLKVRVTGDGFDMKIGRSHSVMLALQE